MFKQLLLQYLLLRQYYSFRYWLTTRKIQKSLLSNFYKVINNVKIGCSRIIK